MIHIFHHNDLDGCLAGAIARKQIMETIPEGLVEYHMIDYKDPFPHDKVHFDDAVYLLDYTPKVDDFRKLMESVGAENVTWVDHHQTNIDKITESNIPLPRGSLADTYPSAAMLAWQYFFGNNAKVPEVVELVSKWDTWKHNYDQDVLDFIWGAKFHELESGCDMEYWQHLLSPSEGYSFSVKHIRRDGNIIRTFDSREMAARIKHHGFDVKVPMPDGSVKTALALNCGKINSFAFESCEHCGYDFWISFFFTGKTWCVSLYKTMKSDKDLHLGQFAARMGGGGHPGAAGFQCDTLPEWLHS